MERSRKDARMIWAARPFCVGLNIAICGWGGGLRYGEVKNMVQLYLGDCLDVMKQIPDNSVDMVLTDPPYGIDYQSHRKKDRTKRMQKIKNDKRPFLEFIPLLKRIINPNGCIMIFTRWDVQQKFIDAMEANGLRIKNVLIWDKIVHGMGDLKRAYASRYESILFHSEPGFKFNGKRPQDIVRCRRILPKDLIHPNEKPINLAEELICKCTEEGCTVLDMFMGSGSVGAACVKTGRNFIGIELDEYYFEIAKQRIGIERGKCEKESLDKECLNCAFGYDDDEGIYCAQNR